MAVSLTACYDEMDDKANIDAKYVLANTPSVAMSSAAADDYSSATVSATVSSTEGVLETGFMVAGSSDFAGAKTHIAESATSISVSLSGLTDMTTYHVKAYAYLADGRIVYSEPTTFTTPEAPTYELAGTYTAIEYDAETGDAGSYEVTVEVNGTDVKITNLWDGGMTVTGTYDTETQTVTIPTGQLIYVHASYGNVLMNAVNDAISGYTKAVICKFTPKGGFLKTSIWAAECSAGTFGFYYVNMSHK